MDPVQVFRRWMAARIQGVWETGNKEDAMSPPGAERPADPKEDYVPEFPAEAWLVLSQLAEQGAETLADELIRAAFLLLSDIFELQFLLGPLQQKYPDRFQAVAPFFAGLDSAISTIADLASGIAGHRGLQTRNSDLAMTQAFRFAGEPHAAEFCMRRFFELEPAEEAGVEMNDGLVSRLIQNAVRSAELLERLEQKYPHAAKRTAEQVDRWPVLCRKSKALVERRPALSTLGRNYALDPEAKVHKARKDSLRQYLTPVVRWLSRCSLPAVSPDVRRGMAEGALKRRDMPFYLPFGPCPERAVKVLAEAPELPALRKSTAVEWAEKLVVPFIMATDAATIEDIQKHRALSAIWKQTRVKSLKTFRSRLLDAVRKELPRMARKG